MKLGSSIQKHQGQGAFPTVTKSSGDPGRLGRTEFEDILTDPAAIAVRPRTGNAVGGIRIIAPDGRGATFSTNGTFQYLGIYR